MCAVCCRQLRELRSLTLFDANMWELNANTLLPALSGERILPLMPATLCWQQHSTTAADASHTVLAATQHNCHDGGPHVCLCMPVCMRACWSMPHVLRVIIWT
jgi:hypothetical protein